MRCMIFSLRILHFSSCVLDAEKFYFYFSVFILLLTFSQTYNNCQIKILWLSCCSYTKNIKVSIVFRVYALISALAIFYGKYLVIKCKTRRPSLFFFYLILLLLIFPGLSSKLNCMCNESKRAVYLVAC